MVAAYTVNGDSFVADKPRMWSQKQAMQRTFDHLFGVFGAPPKGAAMLVALDHTENYVYYFSPDAVSFAMPLLVSYSAVECPAPKRSSVRPCVAHHDLGSVPFAAEDER
jgi:hypothetical protein